MPSLKASPERSGAARNFSSQLGAIAAASILGLGAIVAPAAATGLAVEADIKPRIEAGDIGALRVGSVKNLKDEAADEAEATLDELPLDPDLATPEQPAPAPIDATPIPTESPAETTTRPLQHKAQTRVQLDLSDRQLSVYADDELVATYNVAVGKEGWETPVGDFSITHMAIDPIWENPWTGELIYPGPNNPMGRAAIVFHTIGDDMIAFHGTPNEELLGQAVSHGCVRMRNEDILEMYDIVRYGTAVSVVP